MQVVRKSVFHSYGAYGYHRISTLLENGANGTSYAWHAAELAVHTQVQDLFRHGSSDPAHILCLKHGDLRVYNWPTSVPTGIIRYLVLNPR